MKISSWDPILLKMWLDSYIYLEFAFFQSGKKTCGNSKFKQEKQEVLVFHPKTPIGIQKKKQKKRQYKFRHFWFYNKSSDIMILLSLGEIVLRKITS